jgi:hypothetical protein
VRDRPTDEDRDAVAEAVAEAGRGRTAWKGGRKAESSVSLSLATTAATTTAAAAATTTTTTTPPFPMQKNSASRGPPSPLSRSTLQAKSRRPWT